MCAEFFCSCTYRKESRFLAIFVLNLTYLSFLILVGISIKQHIRIILYLNELSRLKWNGIKKCCTIILNYFNFFYQLININPILLNSWPMCLHNLLTNITFWIGVILSVFVTQIVIGAGHLLHLHVGSNWFLTIDLRNEGLHAFCHTLAHLQSHIWNNVDDFLLSLHCLMIHFDHV